MDERNQALEIIDEKKEILHQAASLTLNNPLGFLQLEEIFGDLAKNERFAKQYAAMIHQIYQVKDIRKLMLEMI